MATNTTLNASNLAALGAERLAELLIELSQGDAGARRRLRMALAAAHGPADLAQAVRKRLATIARAQTFVDRSAARSLAAELDSLRQAIVETVARVDPAAALDLLWRLIDLAEPSLARCDDSDGAVIGVFHAACEQLGDLAEKARPDAERLADRVFSALVGNGYGQVDSLIVGIAPALGPKGLSHLKRRIVALAETPVRRPAEPERVKIGWSLSGPIYADEIEAHARRSTIRQALQDIADIEGDADGFIAQYDAGTRKVPRIAAEIARRLLAAGRAEDGLAVIDAAEHRPAGDWDEPDFAWADARIDLLEALGRGEDAQRVRWDCFARALSAAHLRAYLKKLRNFDDVAAEHKALDHAQGFHDRLAALSFLVAWPAADRAARLVLEHAADWDGNRYDILTTAANALAARHPLAAALALRAIIDFTLAKARASRYQHAARHLRDCAGLSLAITDYHGHEPHGVYEARLRRDHGRKAAFWSKLA